MRRLIFHLKKGCIRELHTLEALEKAFQTYRTSKNTNNYENKKRKTNKEDFLQTKRSRQAKTDTKQKDGDEELFLLREGFKKKKV